MATTIRTLRSALAQIPSEQRAEFVRRSMVGFSKTLRARLVGLVLVLPVVAIIVIIVIVNYN